MPCCGQKRDSLKHIPPAQGGLKPAPSPSPARLVKSLAPGAAPREVILRYTQTPRIIVEGPVTGRRYAFSAESRTQKIDSRDAGPLSATPFFTIDRG